MPNRPEGLLRQLLPRAKQRLVMSRLARRHPGRAISFKDTYGRQLLVSRDCVNREHWRVTYFDEQLEPNGHSCAAAQREALRLAWELGAIPTSFRLEPAPLPLPPPVSLERVAAGVPPVDV